MLNSLIGDLLYLAHNHRMYTCVGVVECYNYTKNEADLEIKYNNANDSIRIWIPKKELRKDQNGDIWLSNWFIENTLKRKIELS